MPMDLPPLILPDRPAIVMPRPAIIKPDIYYAGLPGMLPLGKSSASYTSYRYFRIQTKNNNGNANDIRIADFQITNDGGTTWYPSTPGPMTSNTAPSPLVAAASTEEQASQAAWKAFDDSLSTVDAWQPTDPFSINDEDWISIDLGSGNGIVPTDYRIWSDGTIAPRSWWMEGSNDNSTWTTLDWRSDETSWVTESRTFTLRGETASNIMFSDQSGSSTDASSYTISLNCRNGGKMVVAVYGHNANSATLDTWTLGGNAITKKIDILSGSEGRFAMGTIDNVAAGANDMVATFSASELRCMCVCFMAPNCNISSIHETLSSTAGFSLTASAYGANEVVCMAAGTGSGSAFTAASGLNWNHNQANEANFTSGQALGADASTSLSFTGTASQPAVGALVMQQG